jgi:hypothetical protein
MRIQARAAAVRVLSSLPHVQEETHNKEGLGLSLSLSLSLSPNSEQQDISSIPEMNPHNELSRNLSPNQSSQNREELKRRVGDAFLYRLCTDSSWVVLEDVLNALETFVLIGESAFENVFETFVLSGESAFENVFETLVLSGESAFENVFETRWTTF